MAAWGRMAIDGVERLSPPSSDEIPVSSNQGFGIGMSGGLQNLSTWTDLYQTTGVEHSDPMGKSRYHPDVMGDPKHGHSGLGLQATNESEDLTLGNTIQGGGGLIGDEERRMEGQGHRQNRPLAHASRKLVRIKGRNPFRMGDLNPRQGLNRPGPGRGSGDPQMHLEDFGHLSSYREDRVQGGHGVLRDHANQAPAERAHGMRWHRIEIIPIDLHLPLDGCLRRKQTSDGHGQSGLPAPGL
ncbi:MAG: hypothetical protein NZ924_06775, partial [Candidatus Bipolaricaulota bacterium]|nr:hypothetical protein [Candidatus Bipolaricaulota bacterium]MDW8152582.1 hypothetical protein [Candidatus Bipolaricaulota bacterium]